MKLQKPDKLVIAGNLYGGASIARLNIPFEVSIKETLHTENRINIFPNPTTGELTIDNGQLTIMSIEIFDIYGRKCHAINSPPFMEGWQPKADGVVFNISHLQSGIYFVKIYTEAGEVVKKVVKQ